MQKTRIEWVKNPDGTQGQSWNPIKGLCPVGCWYCYGKRIYNRFEWMLEDTGEIGYLAEWELEQPIKRKKPTGIFVCSTYELFHSPDKFARDEIFKIIEQCPQHRFYILTKFPQNIDRPIPSNVWLGVTVTGTNQTEDCFRIDNLIRQKAKIKFISYEPMLDYSDYLLFADWLIMGKLTGYGKKYDPPKYWIEDKIRQARRKNIPVFLKDNLKEIWGEPLIQEMPAIKCLHKNTVALNEEGHAGVYCSGCGEKLEDAC